MNRDLVLSSLLNFRVAFVLSAVLRIGLILYSEWHDARSVVKYTDIDYRVFSDATRFTLNPGPGNHAQGFLGQWINIGDPYTRQTYRYTPLLALLLSPNEWLHGSFGKYLFAGCDILAGVLIHRLLVSVILSRSVPPSASPSSPSTSSDRAKLSLSTQNSDHPDNRKRISISPEPAPEAAIEEAIARYATLLTSLHLFSPFVFSISTRGSSESVLLFFVLLTLFCALRGRWNTAAVLLGLSTHWKIYPVIYGVACVGVIGREQEQRSDSPTRRKGVHDRMTRIKRYVKIFVNVQTIRFATISAGTFFALGLVMYAIWGYPFLYETYLYHLHRLDHRHNFSPYFYLIYLAYPNPSSEPYQLSLWRSLLRSPLTSFVPQMILSLGTGVMFGRKREHLVFAWFVQTVVFVIFNKVCTSQYFLWYLLFLPLLVPSLAISWHRALLYLAIWMGTQVLWLSQAYKLEFLGDNVFYHLWICSMIYVVGHSWVLGGIMDRYGRKQGIRI
ncbi:glycosyltransferase family 50 protein [Heterobasidion irregulare TC 32-1]|uniref:GPI mannosyltransferase 1 n=1 Tax=Heterobasidion irregulare (strain TC 32-1) TaxID=747525 RepID=W4KLN6_HETIT|nr:glycosyltransferase family 50 protein [Heterobasidion irregulare TC 32-1]ETW85961.1 glycosyltransferase family 50 protein [Heterobasidion irregulare TC 32-1]